MKISVVYASECWIELKFKVKNSWELNDNQIIVFITLSIVSHEPVSNSDSLKKLLWYQNVIEKRVIEWTSLIMGYFW